MPQVSLEVYVESRCYSYRQSLDLAHYIQKAYPEVAVNIVDVSLEQGAANHDLVIATPTFVLNGARFSLGNPSLASLEDTIRHHLGRTRRDSVA
jgi:hypothetical protein